MEILDGKKVAENIKKDFEERINKQDKKPSLAVLAIEGDEASITYIKRIQKNCENYGINFCLLVAKSEEEFRQNFEKIRKDESITGVMFAQPMPKILLSLIDEIPAKKDVEGIGTENMGKLFIGKKDAIAPCTSKAVMETLKYYDIDLEGKKVVIVGRSNIVGKPLIPQLLEQNATVTVCHSKTNNLREETSRADVIIMAVGKAKMLKKEDIKDGAILIDVGINFEDGKIVGDIDFSDVKDKAKACTPVPGGIGVVTNAVLMDNIIN